MADIKFNEICPKCGIKIEGGYCECFNMEETNNHISKTKEIISNQIYEECPYNIYRIVYKSNDCDYVMAINKSDAGYQQFKKLATFIGLKFNNNNFDDYKRGIETIIKVK